MINKNFDKKMTAFKSYKKYNFLFSNISPITQFQLYGIANTKETKKNSEIIPGSEPKLRTLKTSVFLYMYD